LLSPQAAALILRVSPRTIARWADDGLLGDVVFTEGGQRRLSRDAVERLAADRAAS
jgi:excisionase family DNA binding protein